MKNLAKAVIEVMKTVKCMEKNSTIGSGSYAYNGTKDKDVKEVFNDALSKNGLCILPIDVNEETQLDRWSENGRTKQSVFTKVTTKYLLLHESGESQELSGYGHGVDSQDKSAGKATTYALKNTLLYTFLTPVGKIDDSETLHSQDAPTPPVNIFKSPLSIDNFNKALQGTKKQIENVINKYELTQEQTKSLNEKLKQL